MDAIMEFVNQSGFPIVACIGMFYLYTKMLPILSSLQTTLDRLEQKIDNSKLGIDKEDE